MLNPFQIRDLHVPVEENLYDAESIASGPDNSAPNRWTSRHGTVQLSAPQYDEIVANHPRARLTYMDDDDGEIVTVGSSFELAQRLDDAINMPTLPPSSPSQADAVPMHVFDIRRSNSVTELWKNIERSSSILQGSEAPESSLPSSSVWDVKMNPFGLGHGKTAYPGSGDETVNKNTPSGLHNRWVEVCNPPRLPPRLPPKEPLVSGSQKYESQSSGSGSDAPTSHLKEIEPVGPSASITAEGKRQAEEAGNRLRGFRKITVGNGAAPSFALSHEANPWTLPKSPNAVEEHAVESGAQDMTVKEPANTLDEPQPLLEAFEAEMAKILEASASQAGEGSTSKTVEDCPVESDSDRHPKPGDLLTHALKNLAGGVESLGSELRTRIPELERHLSYAQRALPEHVGSTFQATLATLDSHIKNLANFVQDASVATGRAADRVRQAEVRSAEQVIDGLGRMAGEFGQLGRTLFSAFEEEFTRRNSTAQTETADQAASSSQEDKSQADPVIEKKEPVADAISSANVDDRTASHTAAAHSDGESATRPTNKTAAPHTAKGNTASPEVVLDSHTSVGAHIHPLSYKRQRSFGPMPPPTWGQFSNWPNRSAIVPALPSHHRPHLAPIPVPSWHGKHDHGVPVPPHAPTLTSNADGSSQGPTRNRIVENQSRLESSRAANEALFIGNVGFNVTEKMIEDVFASKGFLAQVHLPADSMTGRHAGFGYAHFRSTQSARAALEAVQGVHIDGHSINLEFSDSSPIDTLQSPTRVSDRGTNPSVAPPAPTASAEAPFSSHRLRHRQSWHPASRIIEQVDPRRLSYDMTPTSRRPAASNLERLFYQPLPSNPLHDAERTRQSETRNASNALLDQSEETAEFAARYPSLLPSRDTDRSNAARVASSVPDRLLTLSPNSEMERFPPVSQLDAHILAGQYGISRPRPADQAEGPRAVRQDATNRQVILPPAQPQTTIHQEGRQAPEQASITVGSSSESRGPQQTEEIAHQHGRRRQRRSRPLMRIASAARLTSPFNPALPHMAPAADRPLRRSATEIHPLRRRAREHALASRPLSFTERERDRTIPGSFPADEPAPAANGGPSSDMDMQIAIKRSIIDNCVDTLVSLGYGAERDGGRQRLGVYAEAVGGNVPDAIEMIEEDRTAHAQHDSSTL